MNLIKKPVTGMKDVLPQEAELRGYVTDVIRRTYASYGFQQIETPAVESLANLNSKQGGENEKLIFRILKRGEKLKLDEARTPEDLTDEGLRYDLTVPLVRFYSAHQAELPSPFKALQMGPVWRADRPQKGRFRQFVQCDIDILGDPSNLAEIELILATTKALDNLGFSGFEVRIGDRRLLKAMAYYSGFAEEDYDEVFIILDKMDKIGTGGVRQELIDSGFARDAADKYLSLFAALDGKSGEESIRYLGDTLGDCLEEGCAENLLEIIDCVEKAKSADFALVFDPTLVRGMSYYTGTIFEISMPEFGASAGGGGRYDKMVGKFTGQDVPACGFSIGFERILLLLTERGFQIPSQGKKQAFLLEKGLSAQQTREALAQAEEARKAGDQTLVVRMNKNRKFQKEQLAAQGYTDFREFFK
ncbi:MAG: histidine--tRNA ligase [Lachnospiraceae bacterium]|jgi:histidyl-tRNA synthetase|nr:histidine--tRNA ligase [Lachnospiraceae bacterium]